MKFKSNIEAQAKVFTGDTGSANATRFPNALSVTSIVPSAVQHNESLYIGLMAEGLSVGNTWGSGVYGAGYTNATGSGRGTGVTGEGHVGTAADTGVAVGVRGYATDTHTGNYNIGLYGDAENGDAGLTYGGNVALFLANGNIVTSAAAAKKWYLGGNLTFDGQGTAKTIGVTNGAKFDFGGTSAQYVKGDGSFSTAMNSRIEVNFVATSGQTTFVTPYEVGQIDVYYNGSKLYPNEFTATNGTDVVLAQAATLGAQISIIKYISSFTTTSIRTESVFTTTSGQTTFAVNYAIGQVDVFYNGSKLSPAEFTATNGTSVVLGFACAAGESIVIDSFVNQVSGAVGTANKVAKFTGVASLGDSQITDNGTSISMFTNSPESGWKLDIGSLVALGSAPGNGRLYVSSQNTTNGATYLQARNASVATPMHYVASSHYFDTNVGIGTATPISAAGYTTLTVGGTSSIKGQVTWNSGTSAIGYAFNDATNMTFGASNDLIFATTGSGLERMRISSSGIVQVNASSSSWISGTFSGTGNTNKVVIGNLATPTIGGHNAALNGWSDFTVAGVNINFSPYGTTAMRLFDNGNLFIGASPVDNGNKLQVNGIISSGTTSSVQGQITLFSTTANAEGNIYGRSGGGMLFNTNANAHPIEFGGSRIQFNSNVGIGSNSNITRLALGGYNGTRLPYINGTSNTIDSGGITVGSSTTASSNKAGGLDLTNNTYSVGAISPVITFSSLTSNSVYNNAYAGIWGSLAGQGGDANWLKGDIVFGTASTYGIDERMRIQSSGTVSIGTTTDVGTNGVLALRNLSAPSYKYWKVGPDTASNFIVYNENNNGCYIGWTATSWTGNSDLRLKNIIRNIDNATESLLTLNPVVFSWKNDETNKENIGLIAQDVEKVFPQIVDTNSEGMLGVRYTELIPILIASIKELKAEIEILKNK